MATGIGFTSYGTRTEAIPTASMNTLANGSNAIGTSAIVNTSALRSRYVEFDAYLASIDLSSQTTLALYVWLLELVDGTNYEDGGASISPARRPDIIIPVRAVSGAQRVRGGAIIRPGQFMALIGNRTGAALASSGNMLHYKLYSDEINN